MVVAAGVGSRADANGSGVDLEVAAADNTEVVRGKWPTTRTSDRTWTVEKRGELALRVHHRRARLRESGRISPLFALAAAAVSGNDRSRRPGHARIGPRP